MTLDPASRSPNAAYSGRLWSALALSISLHAALLVGVPDIRTRTPIPALQVLSARIEHESGASDQVAAPSEESGARARNVERRPTRVAKSMPTVNRLTAPNPEVSQVVSSETSTGQVSAEISSPTLTASPSGAMTTSIATISPTASGPSDDALDLGLLEQYRLALMGAARRHKLYPQPAVERDWQGRVGVRLVIGAGGELARAEVKKTSGREVLDREAIAMMRQAQSLTPVPDGLSNRRFAVDLVVVFELQD